MDFHLNHIFHPKNVYFLLRHIMPKLIIASLLIASLSLQGCVHKIVTVPVKVAYGATKGVVKGTTKVVKAVIPGDSKTDKNKSDEKNN